MNIFDYVAAILVSVKNARVDVLRSVGGLVDSDTEDTATGVARCTS